MDAPSVESLVGGRPHPETEAPHISEEAYHVLALLEKPRGMVTALANLRTDSTIRFTDLVQRGLTRWASAQCIQSLVHLGVLEQQKAHRGKGSERTYALLSSGGVFAEAGGSLLATMRRIEGKDKPAKLERLPLGSFSVLAMAVDASVVWHSRIVRDLGMCCTSATRVLSGLREAGLLRATRSRGFPPRVLYEPTENGRELGQVLAGLCAAPVSQQPKGATPGVANDAGRTYLRQMTLLDFGRP